MLCYVKVGSTIHTSTHRAKLDKCLSGQMSAWKNVYQETCLPEHVDLDKDKCVPEHLALTKCRNNYII